MALDDVESNLNHGQPSDFLGGSNGVNVSTILRSWTEQSGFPLISVNRETTGMLRIRQVTLSQESLLG